MSSIQYGACSQCGSLNSFSGSSTASICATCSKGISSVDLYPLAIATIDEHNALNKLISSLHDGNFIDLFWEYESKVSDVLLWYLKATYEFYRADDQEDSTNKFETAISEIFKKIEDEQVDNLYLSLLSLAKNKSIDLKDCSLKDKIQVILKVSNHYVEWENLWKQTLDFTSSLRSAGIDISDAALPFDVNRYKINEQQRELNKKQEIEYKESSKYDWHWIAGAYIFIFIVTAIIYFKFIKHDDIESAEFTEELKQEEQQLQPDDSKNYVSEPKEEVNSVSKIASVPMLVEGDTIRFWTNSSGHRWRMVYIELPEHYETEFLAEPGPVEGWYVNPESGIWLNIFYSGAEIIVEHTIEGGYHTDEMLLFSTGRFNINCNMNFFDEDFNIEPYKDRSVSEKQFLIDRLGQDKYYWKEPSKGKGFGN